MNSEDRRELSGETELDPEFLATLRCPISHAPLVLKDGRLICYESKKAYRIEKGIPVLLPEEAVDLPEGEHQKPAGQFEVE